MAILKIGIFRQVHANRAPFGTVAVQLCSVCACACTCSCALVCVLAFELHMRRRAFRKCDMCTWFAVLDRLVRVPSGSIQAITYAFAQLEDDTAFQPSDAQFDASLGKEIQGNVRCDPCVTCTLIFVCDPSV